MEYKTAETIISEEMEKIQNIILKIKSDSYALLKKPISRRKLISILFENIEKISSMFFDNLNDFQKLNISFIKLSDHISKLEEFKRNEVEKKRIRRQRYRQNKKEKNALKNEKHNFWI